MQLFSITEQPNSCDRQAMLHLARQTLELHLGDAGHRIPPQSSGNTAAFKRENALFVTLKQRQKLRGCIGRVTAGMPLAESIPLYAYQAAFADYRFRPLRREELTFTEIELSLLTSPTAVADYRQIVIGRDGIILKKGERMALFLPQVAVEQQWSLTETLRHLADKAGIEPHLAVAANGGCNYEAFQSICISEISRNETALQ